MKLKGPQIQRYLEQANAPKGTFKDGLLIQNFDPTTTKKERKLQKKKEKAIARAKMLQMLKEKK